MKMLAHLLPLAAAGTLALVLAVPRLQAQARPEASTTGGIIQDFGWSEQSAYNSNPGGNNAKTLASPEQDLDGFIQFGGEDQINGWSVRYQPLLRYYLSSPQLNGLSHSLRASFHWMPSPRWRLEGKGWGMYVRGVPGLALTGVGNSGFHSGSNVLSPTVREADGKAQMTLQYLISPRAIWEIFSGYHIRRYPHSNFVKTGTNDLSYFDYGLGFILQSTPRTQWSVLARNDNMAFGTGSSSARQPGILAPVSPTSHIAAQSVTLNWMHRFTHQASLRIFGGPEYSVLHETMPFTLLNLNFTLRIHRVRTYPSFGAVFWERKGIWTWQIAGRQQISNGGGLFPVPVVSDTGQFRLDHPLMSGWHSQMGVNYTHLRTLSSGILGAHVNAITAGMVLRHRISRHLMLNLEGNYLIQRAGGFLRVPPAVNQTFVGVRVSYDLRGWPNLE